MKKFKKLISLVLLAAMGIATLAGCGPQDSTSVYEDDESVPYEIIWYYPGPTQPEIERVENALNEYLKDKINATVKLYSMEWGPFAEKMTNVMTSGEKYDIRQVNNDAYVSAAYSEAFIDISELIYEYAPKTAELLGEDIIKGVTVNGKMYGIPVYKDMAHEYAVLYRKDIADKYGIDMSGVKTFEDLLPKFEELKQKTNDIYPFVPKQSAIPLLFEDIIQVQKFAYLSEKEGQQDKVFNLYESEEYMNSAKLVYEMAQKGYMPGDISTLNNFNDLLQQGRVFTQIGYAHVNKLDETNALEVANGTGRVWGLIKMEDAVTNRLDVLGCIQAISRTCENPARTLKFLELVNTDPYVNNLLCYGIEGTDYEKVSENVVRPITGSGYSAVGWQWVFGNQFINYIVEGEDPEKFNKLLEYNKQSIKSRYLGFLPDLSAVQNELAACQNVMNEYTMVIELGGADPEVEIPKLNEKLKLSGSQAVLDEVQRQYDEWKKAN